MNIDDFIQQLARDAGGIQNEAYRKPNAWRSKSGRGDIVTEVDEACERLIIDRIRSEFPDDPILSEEAGGIGLTEEPGDDRRVWVIDPLDGTRNFMMQIPFFCCSIGVVRQGKPELGAVYDAIHDEMFFARKDDGAYLNGEPIQVSDWETLDDALISVSWVRDKVRRGRFVEYIDTLSKDTSYFRRFGSAALVACYVACGRIHAYMQGGLHPWDVAAAALILEEAGGTLTDFSGAPIDLRDANIEVVMANPLLHGLLLNEVVKPA